MTLQTLAATTLFDGAQLLDDMAVMLRDGVIEAIVPRPAGVVPMPGILAPGFVEWLMGYRDGWTKAAS